MHYDLWSHVLRCPTDTPGHWLASQVFGEPEVHNLDVAAAVQQKVLGLQVPVDDVEGVEVGQGGDDLGCVELGCGAARARFRSNVLINHQKQLLGWDGTRWDSFRYSNFITQNNNVSIVVVDGFIFILNVDKVVI